MQSATFFESSTRSLVWKPQIANFTHYKLLFQIIRQNLRFYNVNDDFSYSGE